jgi:hypothetical protein
MQKQDLINTILACTAKFQERFDSDSKPDFNKRQSILDSEVNETIQAITEIAYIVKAITEIRQISNVTQLEL